MLRNINGSSLLQPIPPYRNMYADIPRDIKSVEPKRILGLTSRQLIMVGVSALVGLPVFAATYAALKNPTISVFALMLTAGPIFGVFLFKKDGIPAEQIIKDYLKWKFVHPQVRKYKTTKKNLSVAKERDVLWLTPKQKKRLLKIKKAKKAALEKTEQELTEQEEITSLNEASETETISEG